MKITLYLILLLTTAGCIDRAQKTTIEVLDNKRHYYPILQGQELEMVFTIVNTGDAPFILEDVITSCGCLTAQKMSIETIPSGQEGHFTLKYNSTKNVGRVEHFVTLYGNFEKGEEYNVSFDLNVVPNSLYTKDYEELYWEGLEKEGLKTMVEGKRKGYYVD